MTARPLSLFAEEYRQEISEEEVEVPGYVLLSQHDKYMETRTKFQEDFKHLLSLQSSSSLNDAENRSLLDFLNLESSKEFVHRIIDYEPTLYPWITAEVKVEQKQCKWKIEKSEKLCSRAHRVNSVYCTQHSKMEMKGKSSA
jgi:hypothetical protein